VCSSDLTVAVLTNMDEPLGNAIGNSLEVIEAIETLKGFGPKDFTELCFKLSSELIFLSGITPTLELASKKVDEVIKDGSALLKLRQMISYQRGNASVIDDYSLFGTAKFKIKVLSRTSGYLSHIDALGIGNAAMKLGAGRLTKEDHIDPTVGIIIQKKVGNKITEGDILAWMYSNGQNEEEVYEMIIDAFKLSEKSVTPKDIIIDIIR